MYRRSFARVALLLLLLVSVGCGFKETIRGQPTTGLDRKLSTFAYIEDGDLLTLIVDINATRYREGSPYMPLEIAIANRGLRQIVLTRESFTLLDSEGNRYPAASPTELIENYEFLDLDRNQMAEIPGIVFNKFAAMQQYPSRFSPMRTARIGESNVVRDLVSVPKHGYIIDFIYFPTPPTGIEGQRFELFVDSESLEDPVFVKFEVPARRR
jgi:hypothetical protein